MANQSNQNSNQGGQAGKVAAMAAAAAAVSGSSAFGAGYGGAAVYDRYHQPQQDEELTVETEVAVTYDEIEEEETPVEVVAVEPEREHQVPVIDVNHVAVVVDPGFNNDIDPNQVTGEILAVTEVDPNDIDADTVVEFTALNTRYDADGNEMTVAHFHNARTGADMMLVDNNGDGTFDYVADAAGNYYSDTVMGVVFTVDDVEAQISDGTYLAANGAPASVLDSGESYLDDIVTV